MRGRVRPFARRFSRCRFRMRKPASADVSSISKTRRRLRMGNRKSRTKATLCPSRLGGVELYAENSNAEVPRTKQLPCVCRGELLVSTGEPHAEALDCSIRVRSVEVVLREKLARP